MLKPESVLPMGPVWQNVIDFFILLCWRLRREGVRPSVQRAGQDLVLVELILVEDNFD